MAHPWTPEVKKCPYPYYDTWRSESPVLWNDEMGAWLVTGYKEGAYVLEHDETFSSMNSVFQPQADIGAQEFFPSMINIDEPRHKRLRALAAKAFTPRSLERDWVPLIQRVVDEQLAGIDPPTFNVVRDLAFPLPVRVIATVIGVEAEKYEWFKWCSDEAARGIGLPLEEGSEAAMNFFNAITQLQAYFLDQAEIRRARPREDLFTRLVHAEIDGEKLTDAELQAFLVLLLVAGNETTTNNIGCTVRLLAEDAALLERVRADRSLVWNLIEESLRVESPIQGFYRKALVDAEVSGVRIKAGDPLLVLYGAANHDPAFVACPEKFNLDGARRDHLAFGKGVHYCLGANLARIESELAINGVLDRFETMTPLVKDAGAVEWRPTPFFRGMVEYPIAYTAYPRPLNTAFESAYRFN